MKIKDLSNQKVLIWGLGISSSGEFFARHAKDVRITDLKSKDELKEFIEPLEKYSNIEYVLGEHREQDFSWVDLILRAPGILPSVKWLQFALDNGKKVEMELSLFLQLCPGKTIAVTGTRGKSTTTALITAMLKGDGRKVTTGGNNQIPLLNQLDEIDPETWVVIEASSFQLSWLAHSKISPHVAVVTNLYPDHLNWHSNLGGYFTSKGNLLRFQKPDDLAILNGRDNKVMQRFGRLGEGEKIKFDWLLRDLKLTLQGEHNRANFAAARATAQAIGVSEEAIQQVARNFTGLPARQEVIGTFDKITYVNDTTATMPEGLIACLNRFGRDEGRRIHLIFGGMNKDLDLTPLIKYLEKYLASGHVFKGNFYEQLYPKLSNKLQEKIYGPFGSMSGAVASARSQAKPGGYVILSPAAASFNLFQDEWDRGRQFKEAVKKNHEK